ncbi:MAG: hypothetical protein JST92_19540 [Deltaproteobacteria bacterium]|nr:hypothetical protein [Deltaproteobacteria bacterium]
MPPLRIPALAASVLVAGFALALIHAAPAAADALHDVLVVNSADKPVQTALAHSNEPFHLTAQLNFDQTSTGILQQRVAMITATRKMVIDHISGRSIGSQYETPNFAVEIQEPGRKTLALHEIPLTQAWLYPDDVGVDYDQRLRLIASQPIHLILDAGQTLIFVAQIPYGGTVTSALTVSGHYAE